MPGALVPGSRQPFPRPSAGRWSLRGVQECLSFCPRDLPSILGELHQVAEDLSCTYVMATCHVMARRLPRGDRRRFEQLTRSGEFGFHLVGYTPVGPVPRVIPDTGPEAEPDWTE